MKKNIAIATLAVMIFSNITLVQAKPDQSKKARDVNVEYTMPQEDAGIWSLVS